MSDQAITIIGTTAEVVLFFVIQALLLLVIQALLPGHRGGPNGRIINHPISPGSPITPVSPIISHPTSIDRRCCIILPVGRKSMSTLGLDYFKMMRNDYSDSSFLNFDEIYIILL